MVCFEGFSSICVTLLLNIGLNQEKQQVTKIFVKTESNSLTLIRSNYLKTEENKKYT